MLRKLFVLVSSYNFLYMKERTIKYMLSHCRANIFYLISLAHPAIYYGAAAMSFLEKKKMHIEFSKEIIGLFCFHRALTLSRKALRYLPTTTNVEPVTNDR